MINAIIVDEDNSQVETVTLQEAPELNEVLTLEDGGMYEVIELRDDSTPVLQTISVEEDWGE